jgi:DNA-binding NtrC family response regulator
MRKSAPLILVVDRESDATQSLIAFLRDRGFEVVWARDDAGAHTVLDRRRVDCLVTELDAPRIDGMAVLRRGRALHPELCAVVVAEAAEVGKAVEAMRLGAADFQVKPIRADKLLAVIEHGLEHQALAARVAEMEARMDERYGFERPAGRSRALARVVEQVRAIAPTRAAVLIEGERGTGKGLVAQAIHHHSPRRHDPFVRIDCGALAGDVLESALFGHEPAGADAPGSRRGRFELADSGTLFLDGIADTPPPVQVKLLRVIQDRAFERLGGTEKLRIDVRLVAASDRDLAAEVAAGRFREDLFTRLSVARIAMPPLRERLEDLPPLVEVFIRDFNRAHGRRVTGISRGALDRLMRHTWPGNVSELRHTVERMVLASEGRRRLDLSDLPVDLREAATGGGRLEIAVGMTVDEAERELVLATLERTAHDKPRAAAMLGIGLRTLYRKIKQYGLG